MPYSDKKGDVMCNKMQHITHKKCYNYCCRGILLKTCVIFIIILHILYILCMYSPIYIGLLKTCVKKIQNYTYIPLFLHIKSPFS